MATTKLTTIDDLWQIEEPGRYDAIDGELFAMPPAIEEHGVIGGTIGVLIGSHVRVHRLGRMYLSDTGFHLSDDPLVILAPDVGFIRADRLPPGPPARSMLAVAEQLAESALA
jgi:Uma2 family endonuclease